MAEHSRQGGVRSRVFRQVVTIEILILAGPDDHVHVDGEGICRDAINENSGDGGLWYIAGEGEATDVEELTPDA